MQQNVTSHHQTEAIQLGLQARISKKKEVVLVTHPSGMNMLSQQPVSPRYSDDMTWDDKKKTGRTRAIQPLTVLTRDTPEPVATNMLTINQIVAARGERSLYQATCDPACPLRRSCTWQLSNNGQHRYQAVMTLLLTASVRSRTHVPRTPDSSRQTPLIFQHDTYESNNKRLATMQLPASNSPCSPKGRPLHAPPSPNGCHRRMPLLRGLRLITSPVQLSPVRGGCMVITIPALVVHISVPICVCARRRRRNEAQQKATNNGRHGTVHGKTSRAQQTGKPGKPV